MVGQHSLGNFNIDFPVVFFHKLLPSLPASYTTISYIIVRSISLIS